MEEQRRIGIEEAVVVYKKGSSRGIGISPFLCPRCGYIELYRKTRKTRNKR
jgi:predicted RNA-binding Zn-ribbon protein involved in translation (DUF1610 family)